MTPPSTRNWQLLPLLALLAGRASAVSLKNFQGLDGLKVSSDCESAYYSNLSQCIFEDFMGGQACSVKCKASIGEVAAKIQVKCAGVQADTDSLMYRGQKNQLVDVLCIDPDAIETPEPTTSSTSSTSTTFSTAAAKPTQPSAGQPSGEEPKFIVVEPTTSSGALVAEATKTGGSTTATTAGAKTTTPPTTNGGGGDPFGGNSTPASSANRQMGIWGYGTLAISGIACAIIMA